ncbi:MAG: hypothetical protein E6Q76_19635 [Rhizobium sp.]|nr:MAG: hypothetical protein E6Q76_19635 [Rhizobium sp.]
MSAAIILRRATASQEVMLGTFLDDTDGKTPETGLTIANTDIKLFKSGATSEVNKNSGGATHVSGGRYYAVFDATDSDTVGPNGEINVAMPGALPVRRPLVVLHENVYDWLFGSTAPSTFAGGAVASVTGAVGSVTGNVGGNVVGSVGSVAAGGITAASIATGAIDADAIADGAIDAGALADGAITAAKLATGAITAAKFAAGAIDAAAIATDAIDADALKADAVTEIQSGLATTTHLNAVEADTQDIQSRLPAALVSGRIAADAVAVSGSTAAADAVEANIGNLNATVDSRSSHSAADVVTALGAGSTLTALAPAATALSTAQWSNTRAGYLDNLSGGAVALASGVTVSDKTGFSLTSAYDFAKGTAAVTESYAANGAAPTPVQALLAIHQMLMGFTISGTSYTVKQLDGSTTAFVVTLNDGTSPTGAARA